MCGCIFFLGSTYLGGHDILTAEIFFDRISNTYGEVKDYIAQVTITVEKDVMEGTLYYKTPNLLRIDFSAPAEQVLVTDGKKLTIYIPQYRVVMAQTLKRRSAAAIVLHGESTRLDTPQEELQYRISKQSQSGSAG